MNRKFDEFCSLGLPAEATEEFLSRLRAEQIIAVHRLTPMMLGGMMLNVAVLTFILFGRTDTVYLMIWATISAVLVLAGLRGWYRSRGQPPRQTASIRSLKRATIQSAVMALIWFYTHALFLQQVGHEQMVVIAAVVAGMMGAGAFALSTIPSAAIIFVLIVGLPALVALIAVGGLNFYGLALIFINYMLILGAIVRTMFRTFFERQCAEAGREHAEAERERLASIEREAVRARETRARQIDALIAEFDGASAAALAKMAHAADRLHASAGDLNAAALSVGESTRSATKRAEEASEAIESSASATEEIQSSISAIVEKTGHSALVGRRAMQQTSETVEAISSFTAAAGGIEGTIGLIQAIAGKTNLLALNATIEAARAGEAGRGFAVVAGEIKQLVVETTHATKSIQRHVADIQATSGRTRAAVTEVRQTIDDMSAVAIAVAEAVQGQAQVIAGIAAEATVAAAAARASVADDSRAGEVAADAVTIATEARSLAVSLQRNAVDLDHVIRTFLRAVQAA